VAKSYLEPEEVSMSGQATVTITQWDVNSIMNLTVQVMIVIFMGKTAIDMFKPGHHSIHGPERAELVDWYGSWAVGRAEAMCPEDDVACVRQEAERLYTSSRMRRMMR
jgi:hypothetical protein